MLGDKENMALREELRQTKSHLSQWLESWKQAKQACDAWKKEAEEAHSRARVEREMGSRKAEEVRDDSLGGRGQGACV